MKKIFLTASALVGMFFPSLVFANTYATFDPGALGTGVSLSGGNLTANNSGGGWSSARSTIGESTGKWYWEINFSNASAQMIGVGTASAGLSSFVGADSSGWGYFSSDGHTYHSGSSSAYGSSYTSQWISVLLDMNTSTVSYYVDCTPQGTANTGLGGTVYALGSTDGSNAYTANFGATAFHCTVPAGYNAGLYTPDPAGGSSETPPFDEIFGSATTTASSTIGLVDNPVQDIFEGYILFMTGMLMMLWIFKRRN